MEKGNNADYWVHKIEKNRKRDEDINKELLFRGWTVVRFWGKDILKHVDECVKVIDEIVWDIKINCEDL